MGLQFFSTPPSKGSASKEKEATEDKNKAKEETAETADKVENEKKPTSTSTLISLQDVLAFTDNEDYSGDSSTWLGLSGHAKALGVTHFDATAFWRFECLLESLVWDLYVNLSSAHPVQVNLAAASKDAKNIATVVVSRPVPEALRLLHAGTVSRTKGKGGLLLCEAFGFDFYVNPCGDNLQSELVVPAWHCKTVQKADQAFFEQKSVKIVVHLTATSTSLASVSIHRDLPNVLDDGMKTCKLELSLEQLTPCTDIEAKLEVEVARNKEKAEKMATKVIALEVKAKAKATAAATKKGRGAGKSAKAKAQNKKTRGAGRKRKRAADLDDDIDLEDL